MNALLEQAGEVRRHHQDAFLTLARRQAFDEDIEAAEIEEACTRAGKSLNEFGQLVRQLQTRRKLRQKAAGLEAAKEAFDTAQARLAELNDELSQAQLKHAVESGPLQSEIHSLRDEYCALMLLPDELIRTAPPEMKEHGRAIGEEREAVSRRIAGKREQIERLEVSADRVSDAEHKARILATIENMNRDLTSLRAKARDLEAAAAEHVQAMIDF